MLGKKLLDETGDEEIKGPLKQMLSDKYAHYKRVAEILAALSRYGYGKAYDSASLLKDIPFDSKMREDLKEMKSSIRFRMLLESLGPTFIKLGQMLSTRPDLIADEYADELGKLRSDVQTIPFSAVQKILEEELGPGALKLFASFSEKPLAAASIGQVHQATMKKTEEKLAVKIQRPDITDTIKADIEILKGLAHTLERTFSSIERFNPVGVIEEFEHMILRELDYTIEARNIQRFAQNMKDVEGVVIPKVYWKLSTRRVLTMDLIEGRPLDETNDITEWKVDKKKLTHIVGNAYIKQIFIDGFFHADPHHGNLFVMKGNRVCFLDFGAIGYLDDATRDKAVLFYMSMARQEVGKAAKVLMELSSRSSKDLDPQKLEWDLRDFIDFNYLKRDKIVMDRGMNQRIVAIALKHGLALPSSFVLLERAMMEVEGVCHSLDPDFDMVKVTEDNFTQLAQSRYAPKLDPFQAAETAHQYREMMRNLPHRTEKILRKIENDEFTVKMDAKLISDLKSHIRKIALIVVVTVMAAALVFYVAWAGQLTNLGFVSTGATILGIIAVWALVVYLIDRKK